MAYTVTQEDRDAAAALAHALGLSADDFTEWAADKLVRALARHRTETLERAEAIVENCGDMCCGCLDAIRNLKGKSDEK